MKLDDGYYYELTDLLYDQYDIDDSGSLSLEEWTFFSQDIVDESSPEYQQIVNDPKLREPEL